MKKLVLIIPFIVTGCGQPLTCNDSEAKSKVLDIIDSHLENAVWYQEKKSGFSDKEMSGISTIEANKDLGRYSCAAQYSYEYNGTSRTVNFTYALNYLEDKEESEVLVDVETVKSSMVSVISLMWQGY